MDKGNKRQMQGGGGSAKKLRREDSGAMIDEDAALLDMAEADSMEAEEDEPAPAPATMQRTPSMQEDEDEMREILGEAVSGGSETWARPPLPEMDPSKENFAMMQLDCDYISDTSLMAPSKDRKYFGGQNPRCAVLRMYGVTEAGNSALMYIHGFMPYFFVPAWEGFTQEDLNNFGDALNNELKDSVAGQRERGMQRFVLNVEVVMKSSIWGYQGNTKRQFIRVTVGMPSLVSSARRILENGIMMRGSRRSFSSYESNVAFVLRFMVDRDVRGGGWVELPKATYVIRKKAQHISRAQVEMDVMWDNVIAHEPEGEWLKIAPLRILSFDIECAGRKGHFPEAEKDPVIQIANIVQLQGATKPLIKNVFTLNTCSSINGAHVIENKTEQELLMNWMRFFVTVDPDVITGYNIVNFDLPYLLDRARALKLAKFPYLGRLPRSESTVKNQTFSSKAYGTRDNKEIRIDGRVQFDLLMIMRREYKLRSYSLNAVSAHFLNQQKELVHFSIISDLQNGSDEDRRRLAVYCIKDALLPVRLMDKLMFMVNYLEMARVTGVPISYLLFRGQQIKVVSQLLRKAQKKGLVIPVRQRVVTDDKYEGATVIEPKRGYYTEPIATLDFASLYPSIMQAHNLCYTTMIGHTQAQKMDQKDYIKTPHGDYFVKSHVQPGLLPEILTELLTARKNAKRMMKQTKDPFTKAVLNGRQLALKISANSVYGFTGAQVGQLPALAISSSVTAFGRDMIHHTLKTVEAKYTIANGYAHDAEVVYGDTDSVMVKFGVKTVKEAIELGVEAAELATKEFENPIKLEFEKVYFPYLLMNKKRYAGLYWTNADKYDKMDTKGIETVRRDNCALVKMVVEECLNKILIEQNVKLAIEYTKGVISDLLRNRLDLSMLVISKSLGKTDYAGKQAHVELAKRMRARDPSTAPVTGDRVAYVITKAAKGAAAYEKAEDPLWVLEHDIPIDTDYYLQNQLQKPLGRIFEPILGNTGGLFAGDHTRVIKITTPSAKAGGLMRFTVKKRTCLGCKVVLKAHEKTVCQYCQANQADLYIQQLGKVRSHEELYSRVWTQCQRCQGSLHQTVLCTNGDCPIFYRRKKVQKDLDEAQRHLDRFSF